VLGVWTAAAAGVIFNGCMTGPLDKPPQSRDTPFVLNAPIQDGQQVITRGQQPEMPGLPQPPSQTASPAPVVQQVSYAGKPPTSGVIRVRATVNSQPIFDDEVKEALGPRVREIYNSVPPNQRDAEVVKAFNEALNAIIDSELLLQDAIKELKARNPKGLEKIKIVAAREVDKIINGNMRDNKIDTIEEFKELLVLRGTSLESLKRQFERQFISTQYLRMLVGKQLDNIGNKEIREYYNTHINEYMQVDRVKWENIFIAVGPKHATIADAKQFAQQVLTAWVGSKNVTDLLQYDDGQGAANKGAGVGEIKGDIRPRELEQYLFAMKEGEFGPPVELSTGVHLFRVLKRENAGPMPFDDKMQRMIENKLKNEIVDQERRWLASQLRERAVIEIMRD